jgi:5-hydroxyisourate hydrolase
MATLSTHVLDTSVGLPAAGIPVELALRNGDEWVDVEATSTDADGRARPEIPGGTLAPGEWRLRFVVGEYLGAVTAEVSPPFFSEIDIRFFVTDDRHYHVPLLLSPYGYSTYRGS